jgi:GNAT superfamily N-acetyltransferase
MTDPPSLPSGEELSGVRELLDEQARTFAALDSALPTVSLPPVPPSVGEPLRTADGSAFGVVEFSQSPPGTLAGLWSARESWQLHPLVPAAATGALASLLLAWRETVVHPDDVESARTVVWPSRDVDAAGVFLRHGFDPVSVLALRTSRGGDARPALRAPRGLRLRTAETADLPVLVDLALAELDYSSRLGGARHRPEARELRSAALGYRLATGEPVWLAEHRGEAVAMAECSITVVAQPEERSTLLRAGRWGYVNCLSVFPGVRGRGVGGALAEAAHRNFVAEDTAGSYLYYNPINPRSSVFWPRHGYRPLWTIWEASPAWSPTVTRSPHQRAGP